MNEARVFTLNTGRTFEEGDFTDCPTAMKMKNETTLLAMTIDIARRAGLREALPRDLLHAEMLRGIEVEFWQQYPNTPDSETKLAETDLGRATTQYMLDVDERTNYAYRESRLAPLGEFISKLTHLEEAVLSSRLNNSDIAT